jgi:hypothetical protein
MVIVDAYTTWTILIGIFFPSVTGLAALKNGFSLQPITPFVR